MISLESIVEIVRGPLDDNTSKGRADRTRIGVMPIGCNSLRGAANHLVCLLEKPFGRLHISLLTHHGINQIPMTIKSTIEITPLPSDLHVGFIDVPAPSDVSASLATKLLS